MASILDFLQPQQPEPVINPAFAGEKLEPLAAEAVVDDATPAPLPSPTPVASIADVQSRMPAARQVPAPVSRGDDLLAQANAQGGPSEDDVAITKRVMQAQDLLQERLDSDEEYAARMAPVLQKLNEENPQAYMEKLLDEADEIKIEQLRQTSPELFDKTNSFGLALTNTAMFGQLSRAYGLYDKLANGGDYKTAVEEAAETVRLLQKANPKSSLAGQVAAYMVPGSPAKMLFEKLSGVGVRVAGPIIARVASNPGLLRAAIQTATAGAVAAGGEGALRGFLGQDGEGLSLDRSVKDGLLGAALGGATGAAGEVVGAGVRRVATPVVNAVRRMSEDAVGSLTGVGADVLRASKDRFKEIGASAGKEIEIGVKVANTLQKQAIAGKLEVEGAKKMLRSVPGAVDTTPIIARMTKTPTNVDPFELKRGTYKEVEQWGQWVNNEFSRLGVDPKAAPLWAVREVIDGLQDTVRKMKGYDKLDSPIITQRLLSASARLNGALNKGAEAAGGDGVVYRGLMQKAAERARLGSFLQKKIGKDVEAGGEKLVRGIFGARNEVALKRMTRLDEIYGSNMVELSRDAFMARQIGQTQRGATPQTASNRLGWGPQHTTGKAALGVLAGGFAAERFGGVSEYLPAPLQGPVKVAGAVLGTGLAMASSPRVARAMLGASDKMTSAATKILSEPNVLLRMASQPGTPTTVKQIATQISSVLRKDGPVSAAGALRVVADTPFFFPFLHYHDLAAKRSEREAAGQGGGGASQY